MTEVSFRKATVTIYMHSNTAEVVTTRELLKRNIENKTCLKKIHSVLQFFFLPCLLKIEGTRKKNPVQGCSLTVAGTFRNGATLSDSTSSISDMSLKQNIHNIAENMCTHTHEHINFCEELL